MSLLQQGRDCGPSDEILTPVRMERKGKETTAAVIGAMECEIALIAERLEDRSEEKAGPFRFVTGRIGRTRVVLVRSGVGKVNAAICASVTAMKYSPDFIINTGCMGGLDPGLSVLDTVAATGTVEYDLDYGSLGDERGTVFLPDGRSVMIAKTDEKLTAGLIAAAEACGRRVVTGVVASGDRFVDDPAAKAFIRDSFGACGCEMEGASIGHACLALGIPFAVLRSVSDGADGSAGMSFAEFSEAASALSAEIVCGFLAGVRRKGGRKHE